jgi:hypothetical protein
MLEMLQDDFFLIPTAFCDVSNFAELVEDPEKFWRLVSPTKEWKIKFQIEICTLLCFE